MSDLNSPNNENSRQHQNVTPCGQLDYGRDMLAEELLDNIKSTPIGRLLSQISQMPEIRQEKVANVRNQLNRGEYDLNAHLDCALDRVLEELIS